MRCAVVGTYSNLEMSCFALQNWPHVALGVRSAESSAHTRYDETATETGWLHLELLLSFRDQVWLCPLIIDHHLMGLSEEGQDHETMFVPDRGARSFCPSGDLPYCVIPTSPATKGSGRFSFWVVWAGVMMIPSRVGRDSTVRLNARHSC